MENNKNKKSVKFQGDMLNFCDFIMVFVFTRNHHLKGVKWGKSYVHIVIARVCDTYFGYPTRIFDVVGDKRACNNVRPC